jgi:4-hydroxybenzoate polyprenyltransferase
MIQTLKKFLDELTFSPIHIIGIITSLAFLRLFLENFSSPEATGMFSPVAGVISYASLYGMLLIFFTLALTLITQKPIMWMMRVVTQCFSIVLLAPIIDLLASHGTGFCIAYVPDSGKSLFEIFIGFFIYHPNTCGVTPGLLTQMFLGILGNLGLVWMLTKSWIKTILGGIVAYGIFFIGATFPILVSSLFSGYGNNNFYYDALASLLSTIHYPASSLFFQIIPSNITTVLIARAALVISLLGIVIIWFFGSYHSWKGWWLGSIKKTPLAAIHFFLLTFGLILGKATGTPSLIWPDWIGIILLYISLFLACWSVGALNDIEDVAIDTISNTDRPMTRYHVSREDMQTIQYISGFFALVTALLVNYNVFFCVTFFMVSYSIHSSFLRLKRVWATSTLLITFSGVAAFLTGYLALSMDQVVAHLPLSIILMLAGMLIPYSIIKDIPDILGDKEGNIHTLPVTFGIPVTVAVVLLLIGGWFILFHAIIPWFFSVPVLVSLLLFTFKRSWVHEKIKVLGFPILFVWIALFIQIFLLVYN